jgi:hypothetical protein
VPPAKAKEPETKPELLEAIAQIFDKVEGILRMRNESGAHDRPLAWMYPQYGEPLKLEREKIHAYSARLDELLDPKQEWDREDATCAEVAIAERFGIAAGEPVRLTRPGECLVWLESIPIRCIWGGFAFPKFQVKPLDARKLWVSNGEMYGTRPSSISLPAKDFYQVARAAVERLMHPTAPNYRSAAPAPQLYQLTDEMAAEARAFLQRQENGWWRERLQAGPIDAIPLPEKLSGTQTLLFA